MSKAFKFDELDYVVELVKHIEGTYSDANHYVGNEEGIQTVEYWDSLGTAITSCRDIAIKYLSRFGKKNGYNKKDMYKAIHNIIFILHFAEKHGYFKEPIVIDRPMTPYVHVPVPILPATRFNPLHPFESKLGDGKDTYKG